MKKNILIIGAIVLVAIIIVVALVWYFSQEPDETIVTTVFDSDQTIEGDYLVNVDEETILKNGATLTINGNLTVKGEISCENGSLNMIVNGDALIEEKLDCQRDENLPQDTPNLGISIVAKGSLTLDPTSQIDSNGTIQIVESEDLLAKTQEELEKIYNETASDTGEGQRFGPFVPQEETDEVSVQHAPSQKYESKKDADVLADNTLNSLLRIPQANAAATVTITQKTVTISGHTNLQNTVKNQRRRISSIVILNFPNANKVVIQDYYLTGPDAKDGLPDLNANCHAQGADGDDALRFNAKAPTVEINNFELTLGEGGNGGAASTPPCKDALAEGGAGGKSGNFKILATKAIKLTGDFIVNPGKSGAGGNAEAYGKDGGIGEDGGNATAVGGDAEDNIKTINAVGNVGGDGNVFIGDLHGGDGGDAIAIGGNGGPGTSCKTVGGKGGNATATGGKGGDAKITVKTNLAMRNGADFPGNGGDATATAGAGGPGAAACPPGGNGGDGGDAKATPGAAGKSDVGFSGDDGEVKEETGGDGGNGGDGCPEGKGGAGGDGKTPGTPGTDGKNTCQTTCTGTNQYNETNCKNACGSKKCTYNSEIKCYYCAEVSEKCTGEGEYSASTCDNQCSSSLCSLNSESGCYYCSEPPETCTGEGEYSDSDCASACDSSLCTLNSETECYYCAEPPETCTGDNQYNDPNCDGACGADLCLYCSEIECYYCAEPEPVVLSASPDIVFEHYIGTTVCPQGISAVNLSATGSASGWRLIGGQPSWLSMSTSGSLPGAVSLNFNCILSEYVTQTISSTLYFRATDTQGSLVGNTASISVTGYITGE
ncbi:hypothetical protein KKD84_00335 [Patescibacteria group bacterium]|nr:hypothetical protein [Patescibacteria group bacterium]